MPPSGKSTPGVSKSAVLEIITAQKQRFSVRELLQAAYAQEANEKAALFRLVGEVADQQAVPELIGRLQGKDPISRVHIINILARFNTREVQTALQALLSDLDFGMHGEFFVDGPTATSPVQGALGDCWLIAAMASVAWTHSQLISERTRRENLVGAVDPGNADLYFELTDVLTIPVLFFTITIPFVFQQWIGERLPQSTGGGAIYARSSVPGENWPAEIEKAVAVWRSGGNADYPRSSDYAHLNGGDPAWAVHVLKGGQPWYHWADADDTWSTIRSHCSGQRTSDPLVAWTWGSSDDSPNKVDYGGANIVANHAYSILGTWETNNRQYVVLRNPWGWYEATLNTHAGTWATPESWGNANLTLPGDGVFALEIHTFREYYMGFGGAS